MKRGLKNLSPCSIRVSSVALILLLLMAIVDYFVSPANGSDSTGSGTLAAPWKSTQHALNTIARNAGGGDRINVQSGADDVLSATLSLATYGTPSTSAPLVFRGYTSAQGDGGVGGLSGNSGGFPILSSSANGVSFVDVHLHHCGASPILAIAGVMLSVCADCEFDHSTSGVAVSIGTAENCYFHDLTGSEALVCFLAYDSLFDLRSGCPGSIVVQARVAAVGNRLVMPADSCWGISALAGGCLIRDNSIYSAGGSGYGVDDNADNYCSIVDNVVQGFSGAGGVNFHYYGTPSVSAGNFAFNGATNFYAATPPVYQGADTVLTASPFNSPSTADLSLNDAAGGGALCRGSSYPPGFQGGSRTQYGDSGALEHQELSAPPATPTLSVSGTTATIAGSTAGSTNTIEVLSPALGTLAWTSAGSRTGDGTVDLSALAAGTYLAVCQSTLAGLPADVSNAWEFVIAGSGSPSVRAALYSYLSSDAGIQALIGSPAAVFPLKLPQNHTRPAIVYRRLSARGHQAPEELGHVHDLSGSAGYALALFRFDCLADKYSTADALAEAVRQALDGLDQATVAGVRIHAALIDDELDDFDEPIDGGDTGVFVVSTVYWIQYAESVPTL